jgi:hypothetical protein
MHTPYFNTIAARQYQDRISAEPSPVLEVLGEIERISLAFDAQDLQDVLAECPEELAAAANSDSPELIGALVLAARDAWISVLATQRVYGNTVKVESVKDAAAKVLKGARQ